jgi:hypothetical protein
MGWATGEPAADAQATPNLPRRLEVFRLGFLGKPFDCKSFMMRSDMEITLSSRDLSRPRASTASSLLHVYILLACYITLGAVVLMLAVTLLARREAPADPFSLYLDMLPGKPVSAVAERECSGMRLDFPGARCIYIPTSGAFSRIVVVANGSIVSTEFTVRRQWVMVGDLFLLWGKPTIQIQGRSATLSWPRPGAVISLTLSPNRRFRYILPVGSIKFS